MQNWQGLRDTLVELHPSDVADLIIALPPDEEAFVFRILPKEKAAEAFSYLPPDHQEGLIESLTNALRELRLRDWFRVFRRELVSGVALGMLLGLIGFARIVLWEKLHLTDYGAHYLLVAFTVWAALLGVVTFGTLAGSMLPFLLRRIGVDPATSSAPFVATLVDVTGLCIYFWVALVILRGTLL